MLPLNFDKDVEMHLEIDVFGTSDLTTNKRLDLGEYDTTPLDF